MMTSMKQKIAAMLAVTTLMGGTGMLAACAEETQATEPAAQMVGMANPWVEVESLEMLNELAGVNLQLPGVMGVTDVVYRLLNNTEHPLAEVQFQVNGVQYCLRASGNMMEDISGVYTDNGETVFANDFEMNGSVAVCGDMKLARWFDISGQYVLMVEDKGAMDDETFAGIADEMMHLTCPDVVADLAEAE